MDDRDNISDDTPLADAVEQDLETVATPDRATWGPDGPPVEADASDWQEQRQEIADDDRDQYRG
jgi:hypothetical protein